MDADTKNAAAIVYARLKAAEKLLDTLRVVQGVLHRNHFAGLDQNPMGVNDLVGSAILLAERVGIGGES